MPTSGKPRSSLRFYGLLTLAWLPVFACLALLHARWFGWTTAVFSFAAIPFLRGRPLWRGGQIALCLAGAYLLALSGLYAALPAADAPFPARLAAAWTDVFTPQGKWLPNDTGWTPPDGYELQIVRLGDARLELLTRTDSQSDRAILQLHGGAFAWGMNDLYRAFAVRYSSLWDDCLVASLDYRLSPEYPYPCQQEDTLAAWRCLTDTLGYAAKNIVVAGDSAGGNLVLSLGLRLWDANEEMPAGLVCMSPWADLSNSGASHVTNATVDPSFGIADADFHGQAVGVDSDYGDGLTLTDPDVSPAFGDYTGFPPMLLQAGSLEVLLSDSEMVYESAKQSGVDCTLTVYTGMFHVFQGALDELSQSTLAWEEIGRFLSALHD